MSNDVKTSTADALNSIAKWSRRTFWATTIGFAIMAAVSLYGLTEYARFKSAMSKAADELNNRFKPAAIAPRR